jgi:FkbM family methyltransferase
MEKLGTNYGGWFIPTNIPLTSESVVYSGGVGEDISFDLLLSDMYDSNIFLIDPTKRAKKHYHEILDYYDTQNWHFSGDIQRDYKGKIENIKPNFNKMKYINIGLWDKGEDLKFYKQDNPQYVSQSLVDNMYSKKYDIVKTTTIKEIMYRYNHTKIDLLKLDIEGAEIKVLNHILDNDIYPTFLCIEFDLYLKHKDENNETQKIVDRLISKGYKIIKNDNLNITFQLENQ